MSPEQAKGDGVDARSDLWSLGVVLYEALTGRLPFEGSHPAAMMYAVLHEPHPSMASHRSNIPADLTSLIDRLLRKDPVQRPVGTKAVAAELAQIRDLLTGRASSRPGVRDSAQPSLAVLPFANMSTDAENEFFADGLTEDLITAFSKMKELRVVARTSAFQFKGKTSDVRLVGEQLNVGTVLEGSVRKSGNRLRITAQLINVADGFHIWSERYDREMADVFEIQDDIARAIVDALKVKLVGGADAPIVQSGTTNMEAYRLVLEGRHHWNRRTGESLARAEACFLEAIRLDPSYADAHGALALTYSVMQDHTAASHAELRTKIKQAANAAFMLNPEMPEAHAAMAMCLMDALDWEGSERAILRAIDANPGYASAHHWYSLILSSHGRLEESQREIDLAHSLDPLSLIVAVGVSWPYYFRRDYERALKHIERARKLDPNFHLVHFTDGLARSAMGQHARAADSFRAAQALNPQPWMWLEVARSEYQAGRTDRMIDALEAWCRTDASNIAVSEFRNAHATGGTEALKRRIGELLGVPWTEAQASAAELAQLFMSLGDHDRAFVWIDAGLEQMTPLLRGLAVDPRWDPLRSDSRFRVVLKRLGLPIL
jgi:serine/threonine-protein kinase